MQDIIFTNKVTEAVKRIVEETRPSSVHIITDANVREKVLPKLALDYQMIVTATGDENKNIESLAEIWEALIEQGATRKSLIINIGGGVVTDMGGFAAACFKRGVSFVNVPTTLLAAVDAAVGGKTGVNFNTFKNEIGAFSEAFAVIISTMTFDTLKRDEILSGYAEMLKHGLLSSADDYNELLAFDILEEDLNSLLPLLEKSVKIKERIVREDPLERGLRRALNLGHTAGHAFESLSLKRANPLPHGYAVAFGILLEMILSRNIMGFPSTEIYRYFDFLKEEGYGRPDIGCKDFAELISLMRHDKKNDRPDAINFTLLRQIGEPVIDCTVPADEISAALEIFCDIMG